MSFPIQMTCRFYFLFYSILIKLSLKQYAGMMYKKIENIFLQSLNRMLLFFFIMKKYGDGREIIAPVFFFPVFLLNLLNVHLSNISSDVRQVQFTTLIKSTKS